MFPVIAVRRFDFKNSIIAIKLFLVMILNIFTFNLRNSESEWSQSKSDFVVVVLQWGYRMPIFHKLVWFRVFLKWSQLSCKIKTFFTFSKTALFPQRLVSVHLFTWSLWKSKGDYQIIIKNIKCETYYFWKCIWITNNGNWSIHEF